MNSARSTHVSGMGAVLYMIYFFILMEYSKKSIFIHKFDISMDDLSKNNSIQDI